MPPHDSFAFDGQLAFLTYPRSGNLTRERLREFLREQLGAEQFCIARELHEDGEPHLHAVVRWGRRKRLCGADCFDVDGHHPNVQRPRSLDRVLAYVRKEDDSCLDSEPPLEIRGTHRGDVYATILQDSTCAADFLERVGEYRPRDLCLHLAHLQEFCRWKWPTPIESYSGRARGEFRELPVMTDWVTENVSNRSGGAPVPSLPSCVISSHAYCLRSICLQIDRSLSAWWANLEQGRLRGQDLLNLPHTFTRTGNGRQTAGETMPNTPLSTTSQSTVSLGSPCLDASLSSMLAESIEQYANAEAAKQQSTASTAKWTLEELWDLMNPDGLLLT